MKKIYWFAVSAAAALATASALILTPVAPAAAALAPFGAAGPVITVGLGKGFPAWYMDQNGLPLDLIEAADGFGISDPVDPANAFSQELGFGAEGFYWAADAAVENPHGTGLLVLAMESAFAGEAAVDGEQSVFGRIRVRLDVGEPGTYTVTHPFGTNTYVVDAVGPGPEIFDSSDIGCFAVAGVLSCDPNSPPGNPSNFDLALQSGIGPFLTWDTFNLNPALTDPLLSNQAMPGRRYVGNPAIEHAVTGSPVGQNFFRIEGPNIGGPGINSIETGLFAVAGRIAEIDALPPEISAEPLIAELGSAAVANVTVTDDLGARAVTIDLNPLGTSLNVQSMATETPVPRTNALWSATLPPLTELGTFTLPIVATDGINAANGALTLSVVPVLDSVIAVPAVSNLVVGATRQLGAAGFDPASALIASGLSVAWTSDNTSVAAVSASGVVTGVGAGAALITATVSNGVSAIPATVAVTVTAPLACQTTADTNGDGAIGILEVLTFVRGWKNGSVSTADLLSAIGFWKVGTGC
ncbi:Ig-like domain-containing protein [Candidatus Kaiserbacteria bacterium]|nr:Ig-like domain-containing protein [Candidatus Kaiserbacteria bacterium]